MDIKTKNMLQSPYTLCIIAFIMGLLIRFGFDNINFEKSIDWSDGIYYGDIQNGIPNGEGRLEREDMVYAGTWENGMLTYGKIESPRYNYEGEITDYKFNGYGVCHYKDGRSYWGYWKNDYKDGLGKFRSKDGKLSFAFFKDGNATIASDMQYETGQTVYGIDVSKYQGSISWQDLYICCNEKGKTSGVMEKNPKYIQPTFFSYIKATEGASHTDAMYEMNAVEARRCGIHVGAYHFLTKESSAKEQADNFITHALLVKGDMPPALDLEKNEIRQKMSDEEFAPIIAIAKEWLEIVSKHYQTKPIIYTNMQVYQTFIKNDPILNKYKLWIASPGKIKPDIQNCIFWQFTHHGKINGINSNYVDINMYNGNYESLNKYIEDYGINLNSKGNEF